MQPDDQSIPHSGAQMLAQILEQQEMDVVEVLATLSHVLRTPLTSIKGYAETLLRHGQRLSQQEHQEFFQTIKTASDELAKTIEYVLDGSSEQRQKKKHQQDLKGWKKQLVEIEKRLGLIRERQQALQADIKAIRAAQHSLDRYKQNLAWQRQEWRQKYEHV